MSMPCLDAERDALNRERSSGADEGLQIARRLSLDGTIGANTGLRRLRAGNSVTVGRWSGCGQHVPMTSAVADVDSEVGPVHDFVDVARGVVQQPG